MQVLVLTDIVWKGRPRKTVPWANRPEASGLVASIRHDIHSQE
jgi:hypothetical protein